MMMSSRECGLLASRLRATFGGRLRVIQATVHMLQASCHVIQTETGLNSKCAECNHGHWQNSAAASDSILIRNRHTQHKHLQGSTQDLVIILITLKV